MNTIKELGLTQTQGINSKILGNLGSPKNGEWRSLFIYGSINTI